VSAACERLRPTLFRIVEGDVAGQERARLDRHLASCTTCRIRLARERRLAEILEGGLGPGDAHAGMGSDEDFVRAVMARLPEARRARFASRHRLKLAGLGGILLAALALGGAWTATPDPGPASWPGLPRLSAPMPEPPALSRQLGGLAAAVGLTLDLARSAARLGIDPSWPLTGALLVLLLASIPAFAAVTALGLVWRIDRFRVPVSTGHRGRRR